MLYRSWVLFHCPPVSPSRGNPTPPHPNPTPLSLQSPLLPQDEEESTLKRDFAQPTLEDHFDKTVLPKVMQVKDFGRAGRTKYTHLVDQDTTEVFNYSRTS